MACDGVASRKRCNEVLVSWLASDSSNRQLQPDDDDDGLHETTTAAALKREEGILRRVKRKTKYEQQLELKRRNSTKLLQGLVSKIVLIFSPKIGLLISIIETWYT